MQALCAAAVSDTEAGGDHDFSAGSQCPFPAELTSFVERALTAAAPGGASAIGGVQAVTPRAQRNKVVWMPRNRIKRPPEPPRPRWIGKHDEAQMILLEFVLGILTFLLEFYFTLYMYCEMCLIYV